MPGHVPGGQRDRTDEQPDGADPLRCADGDGERVGATTGAADDDGAVETQGVDDRQHVTGLVEHGAAGHRVRAAEAGPVRRDQPDPELGEGRRARRRHQPPTRRAVEEDDRRAVGVAVLAPGDLPPVGRPGRQHGRRRTASRSSSAVRVIPSSCRVRT